MHITSNDCAYQSCTFLIEGISFSPSGRSPSSCTRCASLMGSSSERNWEARKRVPKVNHILALISMECLHHKIIIPHTCRRSLPELNHLPQAHASCWEARIMPDGVHQHIRLLPRHREDCCWPSGLRRTVVNPSVWVILFCHELMLTSRLTLSYEAELIELIELKDQSRDAEANLGISKAGRWGG
jgi:hypothetical protein